MMICSKCGANVEEGKRFCHMCGARMDDNPAQGSSTQSGSYYGGQQYQQPVYNQYQAPADPYQYDPVRDVSVGGWIGIFFLNCIPIVGIILMFVWAFSTGIKPSLKNYARAMLILWAIVLGIMLVMIIAALALGITFANVTYYMR